MANRIWIGTDTGNEGDWGTAANWSGAAIPIANDDVFFENSSQSVIDTLDQSAIELDSLNIAQSFTGSIGLAATPLQIDSPIVNIGYNNGPGSPSGSPLINLVLDAVASVITVFNTGNSADSTKSPLRLLTNAAGTTLEIRKGKVDLANDTGQVASIGPITMGWLTNKAGDVDLFVGEGVTLASTIDQRAGDLVLRSTCPTLTIDAGTVKTRGVGTITTLNAKGGVATLDSTGTITTLIIDGATVDFTKSSVARTVTNLKLNPGGTLKHDPADTTFTTWTEPDVPVSLTAAVV